VAAARPRCHPRLPAGQNRSSPALRCVVRKKGEKRILQASISSLSNVSEVCCKCFIRMLQKQIGMLHMLQWLYTYAANSCSQCFIYFFLHILQVCLFGCCICFHTYNASVLLDVAHVYNGCKCFPGVFASISDTYFKYLICFQTYVIIVASRCFKTISSRRRSLLARVGPMCLRAGAAGETWVGRRGTRDGR
jgi:hypothetical protein